MTIGALVDVIPASWRKPLYALYALAGVVLGTVQIALEPDPSWMGPAFAVYAYIGAAFGLTASSNVNADPEV